MDLYNQELLALFQAFASHSVHYLIIGGFAVNRYGYHRTTGDIDFYIKDTPENRKSLVNALAAMNYGYMEPLLTMPIITGYCEVMMDSGMYADIMTDIPGLDQSSFDEYLGQATVDSIEGVPVYFLHVNHLIENKKATARPKDLIDVQMLIRF